MLRNAYKSLIMVLLFGLLVAACAPVVADEGEAVLETPVGPVTGSQEQDDLTAPIIPETGGDPTGQELEGDVFQVPTVTPAADDRIQPVPVTGDQLSSENNYEEFLGMPVYDQDGSYLGILAHVVEGPQGLSDFALVSTWENLYRTIPVSAMRAPEAAGSLTFGGEIDQFMGSPTFETIEGLNFNLEQVRNAVIGYWQHQVEIQAPGQ
jgi:hypothetical protein